MLFFVLCEGIVKFYTFILLYIFAFELIIVLGGCIVTIVNNSHFSDYSFTPIFVIFYSQ